MHFDVSLDNGNEFIHTGLPGSTIAFNIIGTPTIALANATLSGWSLDSTSAGSIEFDGFGDFDYSINCCFNQNGGANAQFGSVSFDVINTAGGLTPASFKDLSDGGSASVYFGVDIQSGTTGNSGPVGTCIECSKLNIQSVPEPGDSDASGHWPFRPRGLVQETPAKGLEPRPNPRKKKGTGCRAGAVFYYLPVIRSMCSLF